MLPSGITTALWAHLGDHPAFGNCFHVAPLSVEHHTSLLVVPVTPPISTILPFGIATLLISPLADHPALEFT
jgi:hypothetical protein